jgi:hypothetical protein
VKRDQWPSPGRVTEAIKELHNLTACSCDETRRQIKQHSLNCATEYRVMCDVTNPRTENRW